MTQILLDRIVGRESTGAAAAPAQASQTAARAVTDRPVRRPLRPSRPARPSGRGAAPILRPVGACPAPALTRRPVARTHGCAMPAPELTVAPMAASIWAPTWRLTDRGIAVVLVIGLMIMVAALTVVGLTAAKVTGEGYQPAVSAGLPR
jgi:hypothetical protein